MSLRASLREIKEVEKEIEFQKLNLTQGTYEVPFTSFRLIRLKTVDY